MHFSPLLVLAFAAAAAAMHAPHSAGPSLSFTSFGPAPRAAAYTTAVPSTVAAIEAASPEQAARNLARQLHGNVEMRVTSSYRTAHNGVTHVHLRQLLGGVEVENGNMNVNVAPDGRVLSYGTSFTETAPPTPEPRSSLRTWNANQGARVVRPLQALQTLMTHLTAHGGGPEQALDALGQLDGVVERQVDAHTFALEHVPLARDTSTARRAYVQTDDGQLVATWELTVPMADNWIHAHARADGGGLVSLNDWVSHAAGDAEQPPSPEPEQEQAAYRATAIGGSNPDDYPFELIRNPANMRASPRGWHDQGSADGRSTTTIGNNVVAQENWDGGRDYVNNHRPDGGSQLVFDFAYNATTPEPKDNIDAAVTNLFVWNNLMHDLAYTYGFDEVAGAFQQNNFGRGGAEGDAVIAHAQDGSGRNNANFATPPDGMPGRMRMYVFTQTDPPRDGDFESTIIVHEYAHGISNRLTGGPANSNCLGWGQPGGMGEGWGDYLGVLLLLRPDDTRTRRIAMGDWVFTKTIRHFDYSTDMDINPTTFAYIERPGWGGVHAMGEVWASALYEVTWNVLEATGRFNPDWYSRDLTAGNTLMWQLVVDGMKLQPCSPTMMEARDAILQAEQLATGGRYACEIWRGFAKRGFGHKATARPVSENFDMPPECATA